MKTRPPVLIFLAFLQIAAIFVNLIMSAFLSHLSIGTYLHLFYSKTPVEFILLSVVAPLLAAFAIYAIKPWSIPVFFSVIASNIYISSKSFDSSMPLVIQATIILAYLVNFGLVAYFLLPAVRTTYLDRRVRWWESQPRYHIETKGNLQTKNETLSCLIADISIGGAFIQGGNTQLGDRVTIDFQIEQIHYSLSGVVVHRNLGQPAASGIRFLGLSKAKKKSLKNLILKLESANIPRYPEKANNLVEFKHWAKTAIKTGKGLVPQIKKGA